MHATRQGHVSLMSVCTQPTCMCTVVVLANVGRVCTQPTCMCYGGCACLWVTVSVCAAVRRGGVRSPVVLCRAGLPVWDRVWLWAGPIGSGSVHIIGHREETWTFLPPRAKAKQRTTYKRGPRRSLWHATAAHAAGPLASWLTSCSCRTCRACCRGRRSWPFCPWPSWPAPT